MKNVIISLSLLIFISCASGVVYHPFTDPYPITTKVDVYMTKKPVKEYKEIGRIDVTEGLGGSSDMVQVAIKKAKEVGADGIILVLDKDETGYLIQEYPNIDSTMVIPATYKKLTFIAIKYIEKDQ